MKPVAHMYYDGNKIEVFEVRGLPIFETNIRIFEAVINWAIHDGYNYVVIYTGRDGVEKTFERTYSFHLATLESVIMAKKNNWVPERSEITENMEQAWDDMRSYAV